MNKNSLLPKIDELRTIAKISKAMIIDITELKIDNSTNDYEIFIEGCSVICSDPNRKGRGVVCYVNNSIRCNNKCCISNVMENIFIQLLMPKTKPITLKIILL